VLRRPALTRLIAALLLLQWGTAFGHCLALAAPAAALTIEICTADGIHRVAMPVGPEDGHQDHALAAGMCPACQGPGAVALPAPPVSLAAPVLLAQAADPPPPAPSGPGPLPPRSCQPRAPPPTS
jgi:hypothetical protein